MPATDTATDDDDDYSFWQTNEYDLGISHIAFLSGKNCCEIIKMPNTGSIKSSFF